MRATQEIIKSVEKMPPEKKESLQNLTQEIDELFTRIAMTFEDDPQMRSVEDCLKATERTDAAFSGESQTTLQCHELIQKCRKQRKKEG